jgi:hypothetical protein
MTAMEAILVANAGSMPAPLVAFRITRIGRSSSQSYYQW